MPFIAKHHADGKYLFWPDLASAHYAKSVTSYLTDNNINFVQKFENPPNLPECRPIEKFWSLLKSLVYKSNWQAKNLSQLKNRILYCLSCIDNKVIQNLFQQVTSLVNRVRRNGVIEDQ